LAVLGLAALVGLSVCAGAVLAGKAALAFGGRAAREERAAAAFYNSTLDSVVVNLADPGGRRYLRTTVALEYADPEVAKEIERAGSRVQDAVIRVLRAKTVADLAPDRIDALRRELVSAVNGVLGWDGVTGVYFQEFIVQ
jgi:flagellar basal body-associated protein FliL